MRSSDDSGWEVAARHLLAVRRPQQAEQVLRQHLAENPWAVVAHVLLALALYRQNRLPEARAAVHGALALAPAVSEAYYLLSVIEHELRQPAASRAALAEALRLQPFNSKYLAVQAQFLLHQKQWAQAQAAAERGLAHDPVHADSLVVRAKALCQQKRWVELDQALHHLLAAHPNLATAHLLLGQETLRRKDYAAAQGHIQEALRLNPIDPDAEWLLEVAENGQQEFWPELLAAYKEAKQDFAQASTPPSKVVFSNPLTWWGWLALLVLVLLSGSPLLESADQSAAYFMRYSGGMGVSAAIVAVSMFRKRVLRPGELVALLLGLAAVVVLAGYSFGVWHKPYAPDLLRMLLTVLPVLYWAGSRTHPRLAGTPN